jgi:hypothetical protein
MAIGDFCRSTQDCNQNTFFDTGLVCVNGICVESLGGGGGSGGGSGGGRTWTLRGKSGFTEIITNIVQNKIASLRPTMPSQITVN